MEAFINAFSQRKDKLTKISLNYWSIIKYIINIQFLVIQYI